MCSPIRRAQRVVESKTVCGEPRGFQLTLGGKVQRCRLPPTRYGRDEVRAGQFEHGRREYPDVRPTSLRRLFALIDGVQIRVLLPQCMLG